MRADTVTAAAVDARLAAIRHMIGPVDDQLNQRIIEGLRLSLAAVSTLDEVVQYTEVQRRVSEAVQALERDGDLSAATACIRHGRVIEGGTEGACWHLSASSLNAIDALVAFRSDDLDRARSLLCEALWSTGVLSELPTFSSLTTRRIHLARNLAQTYETVDPRRAGQMCERLWAVCRGNRDAWEYSHAEGLVLESCDMLLAIESQVLQLLKRVLAEGADRCQPSVSGELVADRCDPSFGPASRGERRG
ncbi:MAG: hypothetical protein AAF567_08975 [Actinomycetota bacterium]